MGYSIRVVRNRFIASTLGRDRLHHNPRRFAARGCDLPVTTSVSAMNLYFICLIFFWSGPATAICTCTCAQHTLCTHYCSRLGWCMASIQANKCFVHTAVTHNAKLGTKCTGRPGTWIKNGDYFWRPYRCRPQSWLCFQCGLRESTVQRWYAHWVCVAQVRA